MPRQNDIFLQNLEYLRNNLPLFAEKYLKVITIEGNLEPLIFNESQIRLHAFAEKQLKETGMVRTVVLKGRKQGVSTYVAARFLHKALFNSYKKVFILSHHSDTTKVLFSIVSTFYDNLPTQLQEKLLMDNSKELEFANKSKYTVATAGEGEIGRGATPHFLHGSEVASYEHTDAIRTGILKAVGNAEGTEIFLESTAKGIGNLFHEYAMNALEKRGRYKLFFLPWFVHEANKQRPPEDFIKTQDEQDVASKYNLTDDQIYWRRMEIEEAKSDWMFKQEFPATIQEAFQTSGNTFINGEDVSRARKNLTKDPNRPLVVGVDPARTGDRTVISFRRGRQLIKVDVYPKMDAMRLAAIIADIINNMKPAQVFIDNAHGYGTIDRLNELNFGRWVTGVNFGGGATDPTLYKNKRAEMAFALRDWLAEENISIPDDDDIEVDFLCIPDFKQDSSNRFLLVPKEEIKKQFGKSPDIFDSVMLTFAYPVADIAKDDDIPYNTVNKRKDKQNGFVSPVMHSFNGKNKTRKDRPWGH